MHKKLNKICVFPIFFIIIFSIINCINQKTEISQKKEFLSKFLITKKDNATDYLNIWIHSDIQPRSISERVHYEIATEDIIKNMQNIDFAIVVGDIIQRRKSSDDYEWFLKERKKTNIKYWYEIAGNHEAKDLNLYKKYIKKPLYYSVHIGNIIFLFLSDEVDCKQTVISDKAFKWWKEKVIRNQKCIIITITHGLLKESNLMGTSLSKLIIKNSNRFVDILTKYRVDIWICGHSHIPYYLPDKIVLSKELNGTLFIDVSAIRKDIFSNIESRIFIFKINSRFVLIKSRNHEKQLYYDDMDFFHQLTHKFIWDHSSPIIKSP